MNNDRHRTAVAAVAVAAIMAMVVAMFLTLKSVNTKDAKIEAPSGATGLARPHPPLDKAPGEQIPAGAR